MAVKPRPLDPAAKTLEGQDDRAVYGPADA